MNLPGKGLQKLEETGYNLTFPFYSIGCIFDFDGYETIIFHSIE